MTQTTVGRRTPGATNRGGAREGTAAIATAYHWELRKLAAQRRTWLGVAAAALTPVLFLITIQISKTTPNDGPFADPLGHGLKHSGLALLPVVLTEVTYIGPAILVALVAADIVAAEDMGGTLKTILTRSVRRGHILASKILALFSYVILALIVSAVFGIAAGVATWGYHPLTNLTGDRVSATGAVGLTFAGLAVYAVSVLAIASFGLFLSVLARQSVAAVIGTLFYVLALQGISAIHALSALRPYNLVTQLPAWQSLFKSPTDWATIGHSLWVSLLYILIPLGAAQLIFQRRDVTS